MKGVFLSWIGTILMVLGAGVLLSLDAIISSYLQKKLALTPTSQIFPIWQKSADPVILEVYLFNCTNINDLSKPNFKPNLVEVGPYAFQEYVERLDMVWNDNNTVSYRQKKTWHFIEESSANMDENITMLNIVPVSASYKARFLGHWSSWSLSTSMKMLERSIWITRPAREFLFEGYSDPLLTLSSAFSGDQTDRMGFFYQKNGTIGFDGYFNMETGAEDMSTIGLLRNLNYGNRTLSYDEGCDDVSGYLGNFFKPSITKKDTFQLFTGELCKSIKFEFEREQEAFGVNGYLFLPSKNLFDNGHNDEETKCNCNGECMAPGVLNVSRCFKGSPMFASFPHFLYADESYLEQVTGLTPSENRSLFYIILEPTLGIPLELSAHLQYNILLQPNSKLSMFADVPTILEPLMYIKKKFQISPTSVEKVKLILYLPLIGTICCIVIILLGLVMISISLMPHLKAKFWRSPSFRKADITTDLKYSKDQQVYFKNENTTGPALSESEYEKLKAAENVDNLENSKETEILT